MCFFEGPEDELCLDDGEGGAAGADVDFGCGGGCCGGFFCLDGRVEGWSRGRGGKLFVGCHVGGCGGIDSVVGRYLRFNVVVEEGLLSPVFFGRWGRGPSEKSKNSLRCECFSASFS